MEFMSNILSFCGGVSIIGGALAVIWKCIGPAFHLSKRVDAIERHQKNDLEKLREIEIAQKQLMKAVAALLNHQIDGNGIDNMKKIRDELLTAVIEH